MFASGPRPNYGAIGATFLSTRVLQIISMLCVIGISSNFVGEIISANSTAPQELLGTLSVVCVSTVYCIVTLVCYVDNILPFLVNAIIDSLILIAIIVVAATLGKPLTYLNCRAIGAADQAATAYDLTTALEDNWGQSGAFPYTKLVGASKSTCLEMKAVWGLAIALCILYCFSTLSSIVLWRKKPAAMKAVEA